MSVNEPCFIVVGDDNDLLADLTATTLSVQGVPVLHVSPGALGSLNLCLRESLFCVNGQLVGGIMFRSSSDSTFSDGFDVSDRSFCDAEIRSTWLAALHLDSIFAVNRYDAAAWFEGARWPVWRHRLIMAGIPVSPFMIGNFAPVEEGLWYPYGSLKPQPLPGLATRRVLGSALTHSLQKQTYLVVGGQVLSGDPPPYLSEIIQLLKDAGVQIAEIVFDSHERVLVVNTQPVISNVDLAERACRRIVAQYHEHLHRW